jgi:hypothetical protein
MSLRGALRPAQDKLRDEAISVSGEDCFAEPVLSPVEGGSQ